MRSWQRSLIPLLALALLAIALVLLFGAPGSAQWATSPLPPECTVTHWASGYDYYRCDTPGRGHPAYVPADARCFLSCVRRGSDPEQCTMTCTWVRKTPDPFMSPMRVQESYDVYLPIVSR